MCPLPPGYGLVVRDEEEDHDSGEDSKKDVDHPCFGPRAPR